MLARTEYYHDTKGAIMKKRIVLGLVLSFALVISCFGVTQGNSNYTFPSSRTKYRLDLTESGTLVVDRTSGTEVLVPFGELMLFAACPKYSKDVDFIIRHVRAHAESYLGWNETADLPVDFLRTGAYWDCDGKTPRECIEDPLSIPHRFPDQPDKVITAYVNLAEFSGIGGWDPSFDPAWDADQDGTIDLDAGPLPGYVDTKVFNAPWKNYVAVYWSDSWREELRKKIDLVAAENFDGIMLDVMTCYWSWKDAYPSMNVDELRKHSVELVKWISAYAKDQYGSAFLITVNLDPEAFEYFPDLGIYVDGGYYQNAFFSWDGSAILDGYGVSTSNRGFRNSPIDFARSQDLSVLDMEHLGTGPVSPGLNFKNYDNRITEANLLLLFRWAIESGSTPFVSPVFMRTLYDLLPRFTRVHPELPPFTETPYSDWVIGSSDDDNIATGEGDDVIYGGAGDDRINGGAGEDAAFFTGLRKDYTISQSHEMVVVTDKQGEDGIDVLKEIEHLIFSNKSIEIKENEKIKMLLEQLKNN